MSVIAVIAEVKINIERVTAALTIALFFTLRILKDFVVRDFVIKDFIVKDFVTRNFIARDFIIMKSLIMKSLTMKFVILLLTKTLFKK